jgi:hypothetical protein
MIYEKSIVSLTSYTYRINVVILLLRLITHMDTYILGRPPLGQRSALRRDLKLTTNKSHNIQTPMSSAEFETAIPANEWPQACDLDRAVTEISLKKSYIK